MLTSCGPPHKAAAQKGAARTIRRPPEAAKDVIGPKSAKNPALAPGRSAACLCLRRPVDVITKQSGAQQHATNQRSTDEFNTLPDTNRHECALIPALR